MQSRAHNIQMTEKAQVIMQVFQGHGIRFEFPDGWEIAEEQNEGRIALTGSSEDTAFWMVTLLADRPSADDIIQTALESFHEEYDNCDAFETDDSICMLPTVGLNLEFPCQAFMSHALLRSCETDAFSIFVLAQVADFDADELRPVLDAISSSLMWDDGDDGADGDPLAHDNLFGRFL